jgi:GTP-binding protein
VVPLSGLAGQGIDPLMRAVVQVHETWNRRISTARLNQWLGDALSAIRRRRFRDAGSRSAT